MNSAIRIGRFLDRVRGLSGILWNAEANFKGVACGKGVVFVGRPIIGVVPGSRIILGDDVRINSALRSNPLGCFQPSVLRTLAPNAELRLAKRTGISSSVICAGKRITIGEDTLIGAGAMLFDNDFHALSSDGSWSEAYSESARPIWVGKSVFIGARAIILKGVEIGDYAIIGAGAVVTSNVPPCSIFAGNPAREVGKRTMPEKAPARLHESQSL